VASLFQAWAVKVQDHQLVEGRAIRFRLWPPWPSLRWLLLPIAPGLPSLFPCADRLRVEFE
jgi:hypothetical protein